MKGRRILAFCIALLVSITGGLLVHEQRTGRLLGAEGLELLTLDLRQRLTAENRKVNIEGGRGSEIVLVLFDEESINQAKYESPFPRDVIAGLIDALSRAGARTIGLDVYLARLYPELNADDGGDDLLREAIARAGNVVLVAPVAQGEEGSQLDYPHSDFADVAAGVGAAEIPTPFETVRDGLLAVRSGDGLEPSWSLALYAHARGLDADSLLAAGYQHDRIDLPGLPDDWGRIPAAWKSGDPGPEFAISFPIRFHGPPSRPGNENPAAGTFTAFAASMVPILATYTPEFFRDKIVLVGTGFHDSDKFRTPFYNVPVPAEEGEERETGIAGWTYGVEIHANALQNLLDEEYLRPLSMEWLLVFLLGITGGVSLLTFWRGAVWGAVGAGMATLSVLVIAEWAFVGEVFLPLVGSLWGLETRLLWMPVITPISSTILAYVGPTAYVSIVEGREKRFIRSALGKYVSPAVAARISDNPELLKLGGQKRQISVLFSDLAGFTAISEQMDAEELVTLLNSYLTEMTNIVREEQGTLDKYIGDAIMAFWNAPEEQEDHADRALRCAIRMQRKMKDLNQRWASEDGGRELIVRIGVNTGTAIVGNVGGRDRFNYSAVGDPVNLAARLEPANKGYETLVMASEFTLSEALASDYYLRELDLLAVRGKLETVRVYEVMEMHDGELSPAKREALGDYNLGLAAYQRRDWELAAEYFQAALNSDPGDGPSRVYLDRARDCIANPPPADWDFVVRRQVK